MSVPENPAIYHLSWKGISLVEGSELFFINPDMRESFANFNPVVVLGGTIFRVPEGYDRDAEAVRREREVFNALEKGSVVCVTCMPDDLNLRVLERIGIGKSYWQKPRADIVIKRSEFSSFLKRFGAADTCFRGDFDDVICETPDGEIVGFAKKVGKGVLTFLSCQVLLKQYTEPDFVKEFLTTLLEALRTYGPKIQYKTPNFINSYRFPNEATIVSEKETLEKELEKRMDSLKRYLRLKEILWFRDEELVNSVINFFNELGIKTQRDEIFEEDFWITEQNKETVIVEVKGLDKNLARPHISKLDEHRGARGKPDDFPALLVVNSFNRAASLREKDEPISPNEIQKAVHTNVLILRTLDLCNAYYLMEKKELDSKTLLDVIKKERGWLSITTTKLKIER